MFNAGEMYDMGNDEGLAYVEKFGVADPHRPDKVGRNDQPWQQAPPLR